MGRMSIKVGIVEDNALLRSSLATSLAGKDCKVVFTAAAAIEAIDHIEKSSIDVLLADVHLGGELNGIDVSLVWQKAHPEIGVVYLTSYEDPRTAIGSGWPEVAKNSLYLVKDSITDGSEVLKAIKTVAENKGSDRITKSGPLAALSDKQMETLRLLAEGKSNREIARVRGITEQSVAISVNRISKALGIPSRLEKNQRVHLARVFLQSD
jgi:DNA-binding NarL/FixJ family response regulator